MASRLCVDSAGQTVAVVGCDNVFELVLPQPSNATPTGTITIRGVDTPLTFTGQEPIEITSLGAGRRSLTLGVAPTVQLAGRTGQAWVVTDSICWSCRVQSYSVDSSATVATLADPLPAVLPSGVTARLFFSYWAATLPVQQAPVAGCLIRVTYQPVARVGQPDATLTFLAAYVHQIFDTGLTPQNMRAFFNGLPSAPTTDAGLEPAISAGLDDLVAHLRVALADRGLTEADVPAPAALLQAHRLYAAAHVYALTNRDLHDSLFRDARAAADAALRHLWVDVDGSGTPTPPDTENITGLRSKDLAFALPPPRPRLLACPRGGRWW